MGLFNEATEKEINIAAPERPQGLHERVDLHINPKFIHNCSIQPGSASPLKPSGLAVPIAQSCFVKQDGSCVINTVGKTQTILNLEQFQSIAQFTQRVELYRGSVSTVFKAVHEYSHQPVILKIYHKEKMQLKHFGKLGREIKVMSMMRDEHVAQLFGTFEDTDVICLVMEYCEGGDLFKAMLLRGGKLEEGYVCLEIITPLLRLLGKMHLMQMMHRDIKPENIFLTRKGKLKLGDFGLAIDISREIPFSRSGTLDYMAPEVLRNPSCPIQESPSVTMADLVSHKVSPITTAVDVWAIGVLAYELIAGRPPFEVEDEAKTAALIIYSEEIRFPKGMNSMLVDFVRCALVKDPLRRPSATQLLNHPWVLMHANHVSQSKNNTAMNKQRDNRLVSTTSLPLPTISHARSSDGSMGVSMPCLTQVPTTPMPTSSSHHLPPIYGTKPTAARVLNFSPPEKGTQVPTLPKTKAPKPTSMVASNAISQHIFRSAQSLPGAPTNGVPTSLNFTASPTSLSEPGTSSFTQTVGDCVCVVSTSPAQPLSVRVPQLPIAATSPGRAPYAVGSTQARTAPRPPPSPIAGSNLLLQQKLRRDPFGVDSLRLSISSTTSASDCPGTPGPGRGIRERTKFHLRGQAARS